MRTTRTQEANKGTHNLRTTAILVGTLMLLATGLLVTAAMAIPMGAMDLRITPESAVRTLAGACADDAARPICGEWCLITDQGDVIPQGTFMCTAM